MGNNQESELDELGWLEQEEIERSRKGMFENFPAPEIYDSEDGAEGEAEGGREEPSDAPRPSESEEP